MATDNQILWRNLGKSFAKTLAELRRWWLWDRWTLRSYFLPMWVCLCDRWLVGWLWVVREIVAGVVDGAGVQKLMSEANWRWRWEVELDRHDLYVRNGNGSCEKGILLLSFGEGGRPARYGYLERRGKAAAIGGMDEGERARMTVSLSLISHPFQKW